MMFRVIALSATPSTEYSIEPEPSQTIDPVVEMSSVAVDGRSNFNFPLMRRVAPSATEIPRIPVIVVSLASIVKFPSRITVFEFAKVVTCLVFGALIVIQAVSVVPLLPETTIV